MFVYFSGGCMLYSFDEVTGALQFSHKIELQTKHLLSILFVMFPDCTVCKVTVKLLYNFEATVNVKFCLVHPLFHKVLYFMQVFRSVLFSS